MHAKRQTPMIPWLAPWIVSLLAVLMLLPAPALGQDEVSAQAAFSQQTCYLGDQVRFRIVVEGAEQADAPDLSSLPGASFFFAGGSNNTSTMVSIVNGRRHEESHKQYILQWVVTPEKPGTLVVPPQRITLPDGSAVQTPEARLRVIEPEQTDKPVLRATIDDDTLYVGQAARVHVTWLLLSDVEEYSFRGNDRPDDFDIQPVITASAGRGNDYKVDIFGITTQGRLSYSTLDGERYRSFEFELLVSPKRAGTLTLGPIGVSFDERVTRRSTRRMIARTDPIVIHALDLPAEGRPPGFTGLLGAHAIDATATPTDVNVGDPIELRVTISGPEPMSGVTDGPDLTSIEGFTDDFRISSEGWTYEPSSSPGRRTFKTTIRATHEGVEAIPAISLPFFDPGEGEYRVARSRPIPLHVRAVRKVTAADAVVSSGAPAAVSRDPLTPTAGGLWAIDTGPAVLADAWVPDAGMLRRPAVLSALIAPPVVFLLAGVSVLARSRPRDEAEIRRRRAISMARRALRREGPESAVRTYLACAFGLTPSAVTGADGHRLLAEAGVADADDIAELIAISESTRYAPGGAALGSPPDTRRLMTRLSRIDRAMRRAKR